MTKVAKNSRVGKANRGAKPGERRGGRQKGVPNKLTGEVKEMILQALDRAGGADYLYQKAITHPTSFMTLLGKVLPMQVQGDSNAPLTVVIRRGLGD